MTSPLPPRSTSARGASRRRQLVSCTIDSLCDVGIAGTSVGAVAERAGVSKGVVSYHFPTKDMLLQEVVRSLYLSAAELIDASTRESSGPAGTVLAYIETNLAFVEANSRHVRAVMEIVSAGKLPSGPSGTDPVLADLILLIEAGGFEQVHAPSLALIIRSAIDGAAARSATGAFDMPSFARQLSQMVRRALGQR